MKGALAIRGGDAGTRALPCVLQRLPAVLEGLGQGYENDKGKEGCVLEPRRSRKKSGMELAGCFVGQSSVFLAAGEIFALLREALSGESVEILVLYSGMPGAAVVHQKTGKPARVCGRDILSRRAFYARCL